jgi:hypothetical protein
METARNKDVTEPSKPREGLASCRAEGREGDGADWEALSKHTDDRALADEAFATSGWVKGN